MNVGKVIRPRQSLGDALAAGVNPLWPKPTRPEMHPKTGKPPTITSRYHHPTLQSAAVKPSLPVRSTQGVNSNQLNAYVKALKGG